MAGIRAGSDKNVLERIAALYRLLCHQSVKPWYFATETADQRKPHHPHRSRRATRQTVRPPSGLFSA